MSSSTVAFASTTSVKEHLEALTDHRKETLLSNFEILKNVASRNRLSADVLC